eukprot:COSAG03_NODE_4735_length_1450_cov_1.499630_1_plen_82_part_10
MAGRTTARVQIGRWQLLAADTIMEYANGENSRVTWRSWETTANAAKAIVRAMDPDASTAELDELRAQARARNTEAVRAQPPP